MYLESRVTEKTEMIHLQIQTTAGLQPPTRGRDHTANHHVLLQKHMSLKLDQK